MEVLVWSRIGRQNLVRRLMYNLEVAHDHTYVVGNQQWVVHNDCWSLENDEALGGHTIAKHVLKADGSNFDRVLERLGPPDNLQEASAFYSMADAEDAISYAITNGNITVRNSKTLVFDATYTREVGFVATSEGDLEASNIVKVVMNKFFWNLVCKNSVSDKPKSLILPLVVSVSNAFVYTGWLCCTSIPIQHFSVFKEHLFTNHLKDAKGTNPMKRVVSFFVLEIKPMNLLWEYTFPVISLWITCHFAKRD